MQLRVKAALLVCGAAATVARGFNLVAVHPNGTTYEDPVWKGVKRGWCKPEDPDKEERMCEPITHSVKSANRVARCNNCKQFCQVWGDPHLATFIGDCTTSAFYEEKRYTFWKLGDLINLELEVQKEQSAIGDKPWIHTAYVNGIKVADKADCALDNTKLYDEMWDVYSDKAPRGKRTKPDVIVEFRVACRRKHEVWGLDLLLTINDLDSEEHGQPEGLPYSMSTKMFKDDVGACVDWLTYGKEQVLPFGDEEKVKQAVEKSIKYDFNCERCAPEGKATGCGLMKVDDEEQWTRKCSCVSECAAFGDPYINGPYTPPFRGTSEEARRRHKEKHGSTNFQLETPPDLRLEGQVLYNANNLFAIVFGTDPCQFMVEIQVWILKEEYRKDLFICKKKQRLPEDFDFNRDRYDIYPYDARKICGPGSFEPGNRKKVEIPNVNEQPQHYNNLSNAYNVGYYVQQSDSSSSGVQNGPSPQIPVNILSANPQNAQRCLRRAGFKNKIISSITDMGSIRTVLTCHRSDKIKAPYFNACIYRDNMDTYLVDQTSKNPSIVVDHSRDDIETVKNIENNLLSAGWCATGDYKPGFQGTTLADSIFDFKEPTQMGFFQPIADMQKVIDAKNQNP